MSMILKAMLVLVRLLMVTLMTILVGDSSARVERSITRHTTTATWPTSPTTISASSSALVLFHLYNFSYYDIYWGLCLGEKAPQIQPKHRRMFSTSPPPSYDYAFEMAASNIRYYSRPPAPPFFPPDMYAFISYGKGVTREVGYDFRDLGAKAPLPSSFSKFEFSPRNS